MCEAWLRDVNEPSLSMHQGTSARCAEWRAWRQGTSDEKDKNTPHTSSARDSRVKYLLLDYLARHPPCSAPVANTNTKHSTSCHCASLKRPTGATSGTERAMGALPAIPAASPGSTSRSCLPNRPVHLGPARPSRRVATTPSRTTTHKQNTGNSPVTNEEQTLSKPLAT